MPTAYLFATGLGAVIWLVCFLLRSDLRGVQVGMSLVGLPLALSDLFYVPTYWRPQTIGHIPVGIEGLLFSFEAAGICSVIYPVVFRRRLVTVSRPSRSSPAAWIPTVLPLVIPMGVASSLTLATGLNLEWGLYCGLVLGTMAVAWNRHDLTSVQALAALAFLPVYATALITWVAAYPSVHDWFTLQGMPHWFFLGAPLTEIVFGALFAAFWAGLYPMVFDRGFVADTIEYGVRTARPADKGELQASRER